MSCPIIERWLMLLPSLGIRIILLKKVVEFLVRPFFTKKTCFCVLSRTISNFQKMAPSFSCTAGWSKKSKEQPHPQTLEGRAPQTPRFSSFLGKPTWKQSLNTWMIELSKHSKLSNFLTKISRIFLWLLAEISMKSLKISQLRILWNRLLSTFTLWQKFNKKL